MGNTYGLTRAELATLRGLRRPGKIQDFLDQDVGYNKEHEGETCRGPRRVLRDRVAHCMEGALLAAATRFGLRRVIGVVSVGNTASIRVLEKLGMSFERMFPMNPGEPEVRLYGRKLDAAGG